jgi:signal transduction histidine kinase
VFFNLFETALKYAGPEKFSVRITGSLVGRFPIVRFRDRGIGVQAGDEERIFEAGERGSNIDGVQARGTGLGLFICRQHMAQYGGTITLATRFKPTEFVLSFPDPSLESL